MSLIDELKEISIVSFLTSQGFKISKTSNNKAWYESPIRGNETKPSFVVYLDSNRWCDMGVSMRSGDIIDLVQELQGCTKSEAMSILGNGTQIDRFEPIDTPNEPNLSVVKVLDRYISPELLMYLKSRGISENTYNRFTNEAVYSFRNTPEKVYHAVGLKNNSGGFELRNYSHKYCASPKDATTYIVGSPHCSIFEGTFDFLSAVEYFGESLLETDVYVLNGLGILYRYINVISQYSIVNVYLDEGVGAGNCIDLIRSRVYDGVVKDHRYILDGKKDFNEFWVNLNKR